MRPIARRLIVGAGLVFLATPAPAQVYSCRGYPPPDVLAAIRTDVEALRRLETESADRLTGADTRTFDWLLGQARAAEASIADPALLAAEDALARCRNFVRPLRRDCAAGAAALVRVIAELAAGQATDEAKVAYAQAMPRCERSASLKPHNTSLRAIK